MIPIFPLPNVVLFPNVFLPLHIFEPRYRQMVHDALASDRIIGMVLLRETREVESDIPAVYAIGCAGLITHCEQLDDGRYNIVLRGLHKFRILNEDRTRSYRQAEIETLTEPDAPAGLPEARQRLERLLECRLSDSGTTSALPTEMDDGDLVNALSQYLEFDPLEKQALLERNGLLERCRSLGDLLEMQSLTDSGRFKVVDIQ